MWNCNIKCYFFTWETFYIYTIIILLTVLLEGFLTWLFFFNLNVSQSEIITLNATMYLNLYWGTMGLCWISTKKWLRKSLDNPCLEYAKAIIVHMHAYFNPLDVLHTEPPTDSSKTYYNVSVSSDGHVVLTPKLMALGNTIHCVQTTSVINRQVHRLRSYCWISIPVP